MCDWDSVSNYSTQLELFVSSCENSEWEDEDDDHFQECFEMFASTDTEVVLGTTPKLGRRSMALSDIDPKYVSQSGIWEASEVETARGGSIRIQHLTALSTATRPLSTTSGCTFHGHHSNGGGTGSSRFPKLEECAHFHYDILELPHLKFAVREDQVHVQRCLMSSCTGGGSEELVHGGGENKDKHSNFSIEVGSGGQCWLFRRTTANWIKLDEQLHRCVWDRNFSCLENLESRFTKEHCTSSESREVIEKYLEQLNILPTNQITCGTVLSWFEIDNRGRHIISSDDAALNTPAVAAALATKSYTAQAPDELSFRIGEMISVIDMPPPEESIWLRGKLTRESQEMGINFEVGFFPREFVEIIGEKVKFHSGVTPVQTTRRIARVSVTSTASSPIPDKPVLRKHGKIISFFRSMMSRPEKRVLQQKGILRERVFNCDLAEHLLNTGNESTVNIPIILRTCAQFIEIYGISDGIYRVSGSLRNTQRLRRVFDDEETPNLAEDEGIRQDVHAVSSVLKQYFRELPNPLCTYQLYEKFVHAIRPPSSKERFDNIKEVIKELPPPHYRTLEYLMLHLSKMTIYSDQTGMTAQNMAIVWAPNLIRCRDLEGGNAAEFKGVSSHVIVTEIIIRYAERFFGKDKSPLPSSSESSRLGLGRPESFLLSTGSPMKLMSLEAAKEKLRNSRNYIEVGGGPSSLPPLYHTIIDTSKRRSALKTKGPMSAAGGWKNFFSRNRSFSKGGPRKTTASDIRVVMNTAMNVKDGTVPGFGNNLRPVRSEESLISTPYEAPSAGLFSRALENTLEVDETGDGEEIQHSTSTPASKNVSDAYSLTYSTGHRRELMPEACDQSIQNIDNTKTHNRSISHDSYFESTMKRLGMIPTEIHEEESEMYSKISLEMSSISEDNCQKDRSSAFYGDCDSSSSRATRNRSSFSSGTPSTSAASLRPSYLPMRESSSSNEEPPTFHSVSFQVKGLANSIPNSPVIRPKAKPRLSKLRDCQVQTSVTAVNDVGVSTMDEDASSLDRGIQPHSVGDLIQPQRMPGRKNIDIYQYPTFSDIEKQEVSHGDLGYELDRNSGVDDSSTDTTPGFDPYSVTNIIYSPLMNDASSPTESSSSEEPCSVGDIHPQIDESSPPLLRISLNYRSEGNCQIYENLGAHNMHQDEHKIAFANSSLLPDHQLQLLHSRELCYENQGTIIPSLNESQHYENFECHRQVRQSGAGISDLPKVQNEQDVCEYIPQSCYQKDLKFIDAEIRDEIPSEGESISYDTVQMPFVTGGASDAVTVDKTPLVLIHGSTIDESYPVAELGEANANTQDSSSPTEDSAYSEELDEDTENIAYLEIKEASPEEESPPTFSEPSPVTEGSEEILIHEENPVGVDNPVYGLQSEDIDAATMSREVQKISELYNKEALELEDTNGSSIKESPVSRCNSAPLNDTSQDFALTLVSGKTESEVYERNLNSRICESNRNRKLIRTSSMVEQQKLLCKRLSEPSLNTPVSNVDKGSWNYVDAKRLTHRKQSVRELLNKFETSAVQDTISLSPSPSPTRDSPFSNNLSPANLDNSVSTSGSTGRPRHTARLTNSTIAESTSCLRDRNNSRYQHHRFSLGDILISDSISCEDKHSLIQSKNTMTRSDTFPELRNEATKENESNSHEYSDKRNLIPEKIVHLFEVANTVVDNSDPNTRERIEKYKNNRRLFLREKYSGLPKDQSESVNSSSCRTPSSSSGDGQVDRDCSSSIESVFSLLSTGIERNSVSSESPRKRALSEDASFHISQNQFKAFKSEGERPTPPTTSSTLPQVEKAFLARPPPAKKIPDVSNGCSVGVKAEYPHPPLGSNSRLNIKSCPPGTFREGIVSVTTTTVEIPAKCHWSSTPCIGRPPGVESGKKIKDIAAFFERKQF